MFGSLSIVEKAIAAVVVIAVLLGGYYAWAEYQQSKGAADQKAAQEKENAIFRVRSAKGIVDYDTCDAAGGLFDFRKATCKLP